MLQGICEKTVRDKEETMKRLSWKPGAAVAGIGLFALLTGILLQLTPRNLWRELFYQPLGLSAGWGLGRVV